MATVIRTEGDKRYTTLEAGLSQGIANYFTERKKKQEQQKFSSAFQLLNSAPDYDTALQIIGQMDPSIASNPGTMELLSKQLERKFPETENLALIDPATGRKQVVNYRKGREPDDEQLAEQYPGLVRESTSGIVPHFIFDDTSGDIEITKPMTKEQATQAAAGRMTMSQEEVGPTASLMNAFTARKNAQAKLAAAKAKGASAAKLPKQFDQEVTAAAARLGLDEADPEQRNKAVSIVSRSTPIKKQLREFYGAKGVQGELFLSDSAVRAHIANTETILEPAILKGLSDDEIKKLMAIDVAYNSANDPAASTVSDTGKQDFMQLVGTSATDASIRQAATVIGSQLEEGQTGTQPIANASGKIVKEIVFIKLGGRVIPVKVKGVK